MPGDTRLLGVWFPDPLTPSGELLSIEFRRNGSLLYTIDFNGESQTLLLMYEADGETLTTSDEFAGILASSRYALGADGALRLEFGGTLYIYRQPEEVVAT